MPSSPWPVRARLAGVRVWLVGFGTVGRWLVDVLDGQGDRLRRRYGADVTVVGVANARDGFVYAERGISLAALRSVGSLTELPGVRHWPTALDGLRATEADVLVEVSQSPADGEPGYGHLREALGRGIPAVTSNKWPVALHGVELAELARHQAVPFRAESTVMSGTPVLSTLTTGLAGAVPLGVRGLLNATANAILTRMTDGSSYQEALAEAQAAGLAERDPGADVDGPDTVAKLMVLSALVFGRQLSPDQVSCTGITGVTSEAIAQASAGGGRIKHVATLEFAEPDGAGEVSARVQPEVVGSDDPLASIDGTTNAIRVRADPVGEVMITGPGAGPELAGQGVLSDLLAVAAT
jgi:homoserine dehydrogenase